MAGSGVVCDICGNEVAQPLSGCPFCGATGSLSQPRSPLVRHRVVNLEKGMPLVDQALARLNTELESARLQGIAVLILIHGYGSSGKGGAIREEVRRQLVYLQQHNGIREMLPGEQCTKKSALFRQLLKRFPFLQTHFAANRGNPGITLVVL
jgi:hypothetical protein